MAASGRRLHRLTCRRHRYRLFGDSVDSDYRAAGICADGVPADGDLVGAGLKRKAVAGILTGGQSRLSSAPGEGPRTPDRLLFSFQHPAGAGGERARPRSAIRANLGTWRLAVFGFLWGSVVRKSRQ